MTVKITRRDHSAQELRREAVRASDPIVASRILALALVLEGHRRTEAARLCGMDRQTLRDWVHRYNAEGLAGLSDRSPPGRRPRLTAKQMAELKAILQQGPDPDRHKIKRWRRSDLKSLIEACFGVSLHVRSVNRLLLRLGFGRLAVRPQHPAQDKAAQATGQRTPPPGPKTSRSGSETLPPS
jgi:transposase